MPTYVYECVACGEFEHEQSIVAPALKRCPQCGKQVRRVIAGGTAFIMKKEPVSCRSCDRETTGCQGQAHCDPTRCGNAE
jgi:putative FmdB family regulatory protein